MPIPTLTKLLRLLGVWNLQHLVAREDGLYDAYTWVALSKEQAHVVKALDPEHITVVPFADHYKLTYHSGS